MFKSVIKSILYGLLIVIFPIIAGVIAEVKKITSDSTLNFVTSMAFLLASVIGFIIYKAKFKDNPVNFGFNNKKSLKKLNYFIPLIIMELLVFTCGFNPSLFLIDIIILFMLCVFVGVSEEIFFRGIIFKELSKAFSFKTSLIISSLIFSLLHLTRLIPTLLGDAPIQTINYTILQLIFAFLFGIVAVYVSYHSKSLVPVIIWHIAHDFITYTTSDSITIYAFIILVIQLIIMIFYTNSLNKRIDEI